MSNPEAPRLPHGIAIPPYLPDRLNSTADALGQMRLQAEQIADRLVEARRAVRQAELKDADDLQAKVRAGEDISKAATDSNETKARAALKKVQAQLNAVYAVLRQEEAKFERAVRAVAGEMVEIAEARANEIGGEMQKLAQQLSDRDPDYLEACANLDSAILWADETRHLTSGKGPASWTLPSRATTWRPPERGMIAVGRHQLSHIETAQLAPALQAHVSRHVRPAPPTPTLVQSNPFDDKASKQRGDKALDAILVDGEVVIVG